MTDLLSSSGVVRDIGWTLIHFLWQGLLLAALLNMVLPMCRSAVARHNWALGTLAAMALTPVITFLSIHDFGRSGGAVVQGSAATAMPAPSSISMPWIDWLVVFWLAGIAVLSLRALGGWCVAGQLGRRDTLALPAELLQRCRGLQRRLAVTAPVRFLLSRRVAVPVVTGWLRPVILIPVSALAGLPPQQLDALILHELAHIRRLDTVINVMLVAVETLLFYHPAVWWVGRRIRIEREHCCDDFVVLACGDAAIYVEALTSLETWKAVGVLAANGGRLKDRVARLLEPSESRRFSLSAMAGLAFLSLIVASVATAQTQTQTGAHQFAIRVVDESVDQNAKMGPPGDDRVPMMKNGKRVYLWLKRESELSGDMLADAQAGSSNGKPVVYFRLTQEGSNRFSALTRENVGHRLAVIVNGTVIDAPTIKTPILGGRGQLTGDFTNEAEAKTLADEMMGASFSTISSPGQTKLKPPHPALSPANANDLQPIRETHTIPPYPTRSVQLNEQGKVTLAVTIGTNGAVSHATIATSSGHQRLDTAAAEFVKSHWRWQPPTRNGKPVVATTKVSVVFNLRSPAPQSGRKPVRPPVPFVR